MPPTTEKLYYIEHKVGRMKEKKGTFPSSTPLYECSCGVKDMTPDKVKDHLIDVQRHRIADLSAILSLEMQRREIAEAEVVRLKEKLQNKEKGLIHLVS